MKTETVLRIEAIELLLNTFGVLDTERFIFSIKNNNFDYAEWRKDLWKDKSLEEIHKMATDFEKEKHKNLS
ncbi:MAG: hypothetical protein FWG66_10535 [Spirochaetes bacterium]|nr:hypothetical protein [Spirochaetota bacterium]